MTRDRNWSKESGQVNETWTRLASTGWKEVRRLFRARNVQGARRSFTWTSVSQGTTGLTLGGSQARAGASIVLVAVRSH